ncbi:hypothetical protein ACVI1L_000671 [Bradyrhizobium sp. USDA 4516]
MSPGYHRGHYPFGVNLPETIVLPSLVGSTEYSDEKSNVRLSPIMT